MPRVHPIFSNFTAAGVSPPPYAPPHFAEYPHTAHMVENFLIRPHGPLIRRAGFHYVATVKDSTKNVRVIRFEFNIQQIYTLELGPGWIRFHSAGGRVENPPGTPVEVSNPYADADIFTLKTVQSADTIYFFHPKYQTYKLVRKSAL